jgi:hypothetical protein
MWVLPSGCPESPVTFKEGEAPRGPEGQPLVTVQLPSGRTAFVDPNTNTYYLTDQTELPANGTIKTWKLKLPPDAQFSNSHFSDEDVRYIQSLSKQDSWPPPPSLTTTFRTSSLLGGPEWPPPPMGSTLGER